MLNSMDLIKIIKQISVEAMDSTKPMGVSFGEVISINPIQIFVEQKILLNERHLIIPKFLTDFCTEISFDDSNVKQTYTTYDMNEDNESLPAKISFKDKTKHKITVYNSLNLNDRVILMRCDGGQKYIVIDRY